MTQYPMTILAMKEGLAAGKFTSQDLVRAALKRQMHKWQLSWPSTKTWP